MAASGFKWYTNALFLAIKGDLDLDAGIRAALVTSAYTPDQAVHDEWDDVSANEVADGNGYSTHGKALTTINITKLGLEVRFDADDLVWTSSTITAKYLVIVKDANSDGSLAATDKLIGYFDLNTDSGSASVSSTAADLSLAMNASGLMRITAAA